MKKKLPTLNTDAIKTMEMQTKKKKSHDKADDSNIREQICDTKTDITLF